MNEELICDFTLLRDLRKNQQMSIADLSARSGVSASVISKLERNQTSAELDTLYRIARVFGLTLSDLISLAENRTAHQSAEEDYRSGEFQFKRVSYGNIRCMHARAAAGVKLSRAEVHRDDYELCWVLKGKLHLELPNEFYRLSAGMSVQFDALLPHSYEVLEDCELIIAHLRKGKRF